MTWLLTFFSLIGVILNIHKRKECFYIWAVTNFAWAIYDFIIGATAQGVLFTVYFILAIYGIIKWRTQCPSTTAK
jgi:nicotinamide riboside transporter PnuC